METKVDNLVRKVSEHAKLIQATQDNSSRNPREFESRLGEIEHKLESGLLQA